MTKKILKIALCNAKGGTAKTTSTQNLAHALANKGKRVLTVDFDPQASLTYSFGKPPQDYDVSIADVLLDGVDIVDAIKKTGVEGVDLVPGSLALSSFDASVSGEGDREERLRQVLSEVEGYDYVLVDPAPTASLLMVNVLLGVDRFIIPVVPQYLAFEGLVTMMSAVSKVRDGFGQCASLLGILLTQVDYRNRATHELVKMIRTHYGDQVFKSEVRVNVRLSEAPSFGKTVFQHDWSSSGATAYRSLADEVLEKVDKEEKGNGKKKQKMEGALK